MKVLVEFHNMFETYKQTFESLLEAKQYIHEAYENGYVFTKDATLSHNLVAVPISNVKYMKIVTQGDSEHALSTHPTVS